MKAWGRMIILLGLLLGGYSSVFAQDCPACDMPPPHLQTYERVMEELIGYIETTPVGGPNGSGKINLAVTSALDASLTSVAIARILPTHLVGDIFGGIQMLAGSQTLVRDWEILIRLDRRIGLQTLAMVQGARVTDVIPFSRLEQIDAALKRLGYVELRKNDEGNYIIQAKPGNGATYGDLASLLRQLNFFYKQIHLNKRYNPLMKDLGAGYRKTDRDLDAAGAESSDKEDLKTFMNGLNATVDSTFSPLYGFFKGPAHERLDFNEDGKGYYRDLYETVREVQQQYECSIGLKSDCSEWKEIREESLALAKDRIINDGNDAIRTFKDAWGRLKGALGGGTKEDRDAAQQRKQALTYSQRGPIAGEEKRKLLDVDTHIEPAPQTVSSLWKSITKVRKKKSDRLGEDEQYYINSFTPSNQPIANSLKDAQLYEEDPIAKLQEQINELALQPQNKFTQSGIGLTNSKGQIVLEQQTQRLQQSFLSVLALQEEAQEEDIFTDVNRTTHRFPLLSATVYKNINIIGDKNDNGKLYNAMGSVCDQQCSNLDPTCRYPITQ